MIGGIKSGTEDEMTPEQKLAFKGFIDVMVQIYKMTSDTIDYSKLEIEKDKQWEGEPENENICEGRSKITSHHREFLKNVDLFQPETSGKKVLDFLDQNRIYKFSD